MCGINLIIDGKKVLDIQPIKKMTAATHHRGPEHNDVLEINNSSNVFLGHNRLKIIDKSDVSNQPFISSCKRYFLIYNGEIYNYLELRNSLLIQGVIFKTFSDTEVLLHLLIAKGVSALSMLEGMFSFIFYDSDKEETILARDRNGIKPLHYYRDESFFIASSETRGVLASGLVLKTLNEEQVYHYLKFKFAKAPETFFRNIYSVMPGHYILIGKNNSLYTHPYVKTEMNREVIPLDASAIVEKTEELLIDAISTQLTAEVPSGVFLSGGVDSTLLLALIKNSGLPTVPSFSIVHKKKEGTFGTQDYLYAKKAAAMYESYHYEVEVDINDLKQFDEFIHHMDQPIGDSAAFLTYKLSYEAKKKVGVVLSGAGADEVFAGYNRHHAFRWFLEHHNLIQKFSDPLKYLLPLLPSGFNHPLRKKIQLVKKFIRNVTPEPGVTFKNFSSLSIIKNDFTDYDCGFKEPSDIEGNLKAALEFDKNNFLISDVLALSDLMTMVYGLEVRVPYLDSALNDYIDQIPATQLYSGSRKWILNNILSKYGGKAFVKRRKEGMGLPFGNWLKQAPNNEAVRYINATSCILYKYLPEESIKTLLQNHLKGKADNTLELWAIVVLEAWLQKEFK